MAELFATNVKVERIQGIVWSFREVYYDTSGDTIEVEATAKSVAAFPKDPGDTAPSVSLDPNPDSSTGLKTVTMTSGDAGKSVILVIRHIGQSVGAVNVVQVAKDDA